MVTLNVFVRSIEREIQRNNRENARRFKEQEKQQLIYDAQRAVENWEKYISTLTSIHQDCSERIDWVELNELPKPKPPQKSNKNEQKAQSQLLNYSPSLFDRIFGLVSKNVKVMEKEVENSKQKDSENYRIAIDEYKTKLEEWKTVQDLSTNVLKHNFNSYPMVIDYYKPFSELSEYGISVKIFDSGSFVDIEVIVENEGIIPNYTLSLTSTGKLSNKKMPQTRQLEIYQDYVCSAVLRVSREIFAHLPLEKARVSAVSNRLNSQTGFIEQVPIVSVISVRHTLTILNLSSVDPSDCIKNFIHKMNFKKTSGLEVIEKVNFPA